MARGSKLKKPKSTKAQKEAKLGYYLVLKDPDAKKKLQATLFLQILKTVCKALHILHHNEHNFFRPFYILVPHPIQSYYIVWLEALL